jgi:hypothetical protein
LESINFKGSNDPTMIPVLRFIDFIDTSAKPTEKWISYRNRTQAGKVLASGIIKGYGDLFSVYPDANKKSDDELKSFFSSRTSGGEQVIQKTLTTLKTLCSLANFDDNKYEDQERMNSDLQHNDPKLDQKKDHRIRLESGYTINLNIQLTLPETTDETVYDKLFSSMKKNLLS